MCTTCFEELKCADNIWRYIVALYQQPEGFTAPEGFTGPLEISKMDFLKYVEDSNLGPLVAVRSRLHSHRAIRQTNLQPVF